MNALFKFSSIGSILLTSLSWLANDIDWRFYDATVIVPFVHIGQFLAAMAGFVMACLAIADRLDRWRKK